MDKADVERLKESFKPVLNGGRRFFGREVYDNHIEVKVTDSECFRVATEQEIKAQKGE